MSAQTDLYDSIFQDIMALTKRPALVDETHLALRTATRTAHFGGAYSRDVSEQPVQIPNASYITSLDGQILFPRIRGLANVQLMDGTGAVMAKPEITVVEFGDIRDPVYHQIKNDIAYLAGTAVNIRSSVPASGYLVSFYQAPLVSRETYNSWIAQLAPDIIIYQAAATILGTVDDGRKAKTYMEMVERVLRPQLNQNFLTSEMR